MQPNIRKLSSTPIAMCAQWKQEMDVVVVLIKVNAIDCIKLRLNLTG